MKNAVIIMAKVPEPGRVKTRLQPFLSQAQSASLSVALLRDAESKSRKVTENTIVAFTPSRLRNRLASVLQHEHILLEQSGTDLGERMANAFRQAFELGYKNLVMIGTDSPTFPANVLGEAFMALEGNNDVVIAKTEDGGFYLIGLNKARDQIFSGVDWGSPATFTQTAANIKLQGVKLSLLPGCFDIDRKQDLLRVVAQLEKEPGLAPATAKWAKDQSLRTRE